MYKCVPVVTVPMSRVAQSARLAANIPILFIKALIPSVNTMPNVCNNKQKCC